MDVIIDEKLLCGDDSKKGDRRSLTAGQLFGGQTVRAGFSLSCLPTFTVIPSSTITAACPAMRFFHKLQLENWFPTADGCAPRRSLYLFTKTATSVDRG